MDVKKKLKGNIATIPDGYLIDCTEPDSPRLYIIENEIVSHDPFKHIGVQILKFATSFEDAKHDVRRFSYGGHSNEMKPTASALSRAARNPPAGT